MSNKAMTINFSNDLGYSSIKGELNGNPILIPSVVAPITSTETFAPKTFGSKSEESSYMNNFLNNMDVTVQSSAVKTNARMFVGNRAINSTLPQESFDVLDMSGKSSTDLSLILTLSTIAGYAIRDYYKKNHKIPTSNLNVNTDMATALPIIESQRPNIKRNYRNRYLKNNHVVVFHNFSNMISVNITFNNVVVGSEGATALLAIRQSYKKNKVLAQGIKDDFYQQYKDIADSFHPSAKDLVTAPNILTVDIGEGTTDFAVFNTDNSTKHIVLNKQASSSINMGYGNVLSRAIESLHEQGLPVDNRTNLKSLLNEPRTMFNASNHDLAKKDVNAQKPRLVHAITNGLSTTLSKSNSSQTSMIFVYGGGAIPMESALREPMVNKTRHFSNITSKDGIPVIFINKNFAQDMNLMGLESVLTMIKGE